ncbi:undecaprenyl-phosphate glucose phosphotransferase [Endozoicomonas sp. OPT23]|uniref:undecaprenyl-phosphate glucose phosphotransferase n=1 Tax=Endozoicomonas sp. OPT23 TaxID=2072845 RepID=UPI00129A6495|nr:undecaprenyl-phosphate glucose phosphotransferase [Endozoicomonas sp. OPT23]MRI34275.1 undecaprenyl-phosphate glucose phosphotransferase [Endozoicomonas sp. OPT23]
MPSSLLSGRSKLPLFCLVAFDLIVALGCAEIAEYLRFGDHVGKHNINLMLIQALLVIVFSFLCGVYQPWRGRNLLERFGMVFLAWGLSFVGLVAYLVMTKTTGKYSRIWLGYWVLISIPVTIIARASCYQLLAKFRAKGRNTRHVLVIGSGRNYQNIVETFGKDNALGFRLADSIDHTGMNETLAKLAEVIARGQLYDECWLCLPLSEHKLLQPIMYELRHHTLNIRFMPGLADLPLLNHKTTPIGGFYSLDISCSPMDESSRVIKKLEDIVIGSLILLLISPVMLAVAAAVKLSSPGPVFFRQLRHGADGRPIKVYKFRSMKMHDESEGQVTQAKKGDSRVTRVGAFIRRTSLDELPQFINVLQGRMSIVGPRPHALAHNEYYKDLVQSYMKRHKVKPGITGLAQVRGFRGETDTLDKMQNRVECDLEYINNWSLWLDLKIIVGTVFKGFVNPNAY